MRIVVAGFVMAARAAIYPVSRGTTGVFHADRLIVDAKVTATRGFVGPGVSRGANFQPARTR